MVSISSINGSIPCCTNSNSSFVKNVCIAIIMKYQKTLVMTFGYKGKGNGEIEYMTVYFTSKSMTIINDKDRCYS